MSNDLLVCGSCFHLIDRTATHVCDAPAPSSRRAELAEAQAEITRLTVERDQWHDSVRHADAEAARMTAERDAFRDASEDHSDLLRAAEDRIKTMASVVEAATALVAHHVRQPVTRLAAVHSKDHELCELLDKLVAAVEEGGKP